MADIFISYASADRSLVEKLAAFFESKGYAVWFDKALEPASQYRNSIMEQIDEVRVVVCIWTPTSIRSDWCRAEANRARVLGKLISVRSSDLNPDQIPLPFGELHTILLGEEEQIERAVVKQLLAPRKMAAWYWRWWGGAKHEALTWFGIIGAILTLTTGLKELVHFASLVSLLTGQFLDVTNKFWSAALAFLPQVTRYDSVLLNLWLFFFVLFLMACSRDYVTPPLLSEKYLRDHLFGAIAAFIIVYIFSLTAKQLHDQADGRADSYVFSNLTAWVATHVLRSDFSTTLAVSRMLVTLVLIVTPVAVTLGIGYRFDPARYAGMMWRVVAGLTAVGVLNFLHEKLTASGVIRELT